MADSPPDGAGRMSRRAFLAAGAAGFASLAGCAGVVDLGIHGEDSGLRGTVVVDGSNTVLPHGAAVAEEFLWRNNRVNIPVRGSGTGAGFQQFCQGSTDLQNASRPIADDEIGGCTDTGIEYLELTALRDGIAVFVHPENDWCDDLSVEELRAIWESGSSVETWADVREGWPAERIRLFGRDPASGTFDSYTERLMGEVGNIRDDYSASADTNVIVRGVSGNRYALGWGGAGYFYENEDRLKLVGVDDPDGPVEGPVRPTTATIESEEYTPLTRWMFVYVNATEFDREVMREFVRFYFEEIDDDTHEEAVESGVVESDERLTWTQWAARRVGFYAADDETVAESRKKLETAIEEYR